MPGLHAHELRAIHERALPYQEYLAAHADRAEPWRTVEAQTKLTDAQRKLIESFKRHMPVLVLCGVWCGDCSAQGPLMYRMAEANSVIDLRFIEREDAMDLAEKMTINQGLRVPTVLCMAEDFEFVSVIGDRTISRYRAVAARKLGAACPLPGAPIAQNEVDAALQDWLNHFEHAQLILRLSTRLRERHGD